MKQFKKVLSLLLCTVVMWGGGLLTSCSDSGDDSPSTVAVTGVTLDKTTVGVTAGETVTLTATVAPDNATNKNLTWSSGNESVATVNAGTVTGVAEGTATILVKSESNPDKTASCTVTVVSAATAEMAKASAGTYTIGDTVITINADGSVTATKSGDEVAAKVTVAEGGSVTITVGEGDTATTYTASKTADGKIDTTTVKDSEGNAVEVEFKEAEDEQQQEEETSLELSTLWKFSDYAEALGATTTSTAVGEEKTCGIVVMGKNVKIRSDGAGISGTITDGVTGYCQLSNGKDGALLLTVPAGTEKIVLGAKNVNGLKIVADDGTTVLKEFPAVADSNYANYEYEYSFTAETKVYIGPFETSKTCNFKAIALYETAVVLDPPSASSFTANSSAAGYSITVDAAKETVTGLEYSVDNGTTWTKVESETIALTTYGTVKIRYAATEVAGASKAVSVTVAEYVDTTLPQAAAPEASNFTVVDIVNGKGSITLTSKDGIEYLNSSDEWVSAEASYEVTTAGKYKFRTAGVEGTSRASEAIEVEVGTYTLSVSAETVWDMTSHANAKVWNTIPERDASANVAAIITTAADSYVGYLGKGLSVVSGTAFEYVASGRGLGYSKWAGDSATDEEKAANVGKIVPAVQTVEAMPGPFKVSVTPKTNKPARSLAFYVSKTADALFAGEPVYSAAIEAKEISYTYTGTDEVFVGFGTISTDGTVYTEISKIVVVAADTIPEDEFPATAVSFVDEEKNAITSLTLSKAQAVAGYELSTSLTPSYSTDKVTYAIKETETNGISVTDGKVTVAEDYAGNKAVTVVASARDGVTAELSVSVNAVIALAADSVVTVGLASPDDAAAIYTTGSTTLKASLDKDYSDIASYEWYVGETKQAETGATFEFSNETAGTYSITAKAVSSESVTTAASAAFVVTVKNLPAIISYFADLTSTSTLSYEGKTSGTTTMITTAGNAVYGAAESAKITVGPELGEGKSGKGYGITVGNSESITPADGTLIWWVSIPVTMAQNVKLAHVSAKSSCNKTSNYYLRAYIGDTQIASASGSSNIADINADISENNSISASVETTIKIAFVGKGKEIKAATKDSAVLGNMTINSIELVFEE